MSLFTFRPTDKPAPVVAGMRNAGTLRIECSRRDVRGRLREYLRQAGTAYEASGESIDVRTDDLDRLALELSIRLSPDEQAAARVSFGPDGCGRPPAARCLRCLLREAQGRWVSGVLRSGRLTSVFQPIVRCGRNEVYGFEALMRAGDAAQVFDAARLLASARAAGLGLQLDRHACRAAVSEAARHRISTKLFVNVAPASLCGPGRRVVQTVRALEALRLSPHQIVFELVEGEPVSDWARLREVLELYRERGFQFALDDFGAAYSSPVMLCELRPDYVKLDRALVRDVHVDSCRAALTRKLIEAARDSGARIVAEGIESAGEYEWALAAGVEFAQGFYISPPAAPPPFMHAA
jgi:EAL domain-containing protein (putative c-di-GMP-specific phosphodiesterase class I)